MPCTYPNPPAVTTWEIVWLENGHNFRERIEVPTREAARAEAVKRHGEREYTIWAYLGEPVYGNEVRSGGSRRANGTRW